MNSGRRPQQIYWTTEGFLPYRTKKKTAYNPDDMRFQVIAWEGLSIFKLVYSRTHNRAVFYISLKVYVRYRLSYRRYQEDTKVPVHTQIH